MRPVSVGPKFDVDVILSGMQLDDGYLALLSLQRTRGFSGEESELWLSARMPHLSLDWIMEKYLTYSPTVPIQLTAPPREFFFLLASIAMAHHAWLFLSER